MLKTNQEMLEEKIAYANRKIEKYNARIESLTELVKYNRAIIENLRAKRKNEKVIFNVEKNEARILKKGFEKSSAYEENLKKENLELAVQIERTERHLKSITDTRDKLTKILNKSKSQDSKDLKK